AWDGVWTCVAFSVPESDGHRRPRLRKRLRALGLGALFDGLWITPHAPLDAIDRALRELEITEATVLRATEVPRPAGVAMVDAWDLRSLRRRYDDVVALADRIVDRLDRGQVTTTEALVARTELMRRWRAIALADPRLPDELLPDDWPCRPARARFEVAYDGLGPLAEARVRELVGLVTAGLDDEESNDPDGGPRHHTVRDLATAPP
ncbi:MAG TPA: PaaX family transcriptional regulator C-terminal domain-containing protein, partial [Acidimicrobiales bacterium]